jgi:hypothetical protein
MEVFALMLRFDARKIGLVRSLGEVLTATVSLVSGSGFSRTELRFAKTPWWWCWDLRGKPSAQVNTQMASGRNHACTRAR